jgi:hypothetical protein
MGRIVLLELRCIAERELKFSYAYKTANVTNTTTTTTLSELQPFFC